MTRDPGDLMIERQHGLDGAHGVLGELGLAGPPTDVYVALVANGAQVPDDLSSLTGHAPDVVGQAVAVLQDLGLVATEHGRLHAVTPGTPLQLLARDLTRKASIAQTAAHELGQLWSLHQGRADYIEIMPTMAAARSIQTRILAEASSQVRALSIGSSRTPRMAEGLASTLTRGVTVRAIYGASVLANPDALDVVQQCIAMGEHSRVFPNVPMNLLICDDRIALIVVRVESDRRADGVVIHESDLLTTVAGVFEAFWRLAVPVSLSTSAIHLDKDNPETQRLLSNLAAGLTDAAIASDLDVSERTVRRRISQLQELLGAQTRFQLGVQASRHGWL